MWKQESDGDGDKDSSIKGWVAGEDSKEDEEARTTKNRMEWKAKGMG